MSKPIAVKGVTPYPYSPPPAINTRFDQPVLPEVRGTAQKVDTAVRVASTALQPKAIPSRGRLQTKELVRAPVAPTLPSSPDASPITYATPDDPDDHNQFLLELFPLEL